MITKTMTAIIYQVNPGGSQSMVKISEINSVYQNTFWVNDTTFLKMMKLLKKCEKSRREPIFEFDISFDCAGDNNDCGYFGSVNDIREA